MKGTVIRRGTRWAVVIDLGRDPISGRRTRKWHSGFDSKREAERARIEILSRIQRGLYVEPNKLRFGEYLLAEWLPATEPTLRASTLQSYEMNVKNHIVPHVGSVPLQKLTPSHLNSLYAHLLATGRRDHRGGLSSKTVRYIHTIIHKALQDATKWNLVARNVAAASDPPRPQPPNLRSTWSAGELSQFLDLIRGERLYAAWLLAASTGMRRGEVLGLRWEDVDFDEGMVSVRHTLISVAYEIRDSTPKTRRGQRMIALDRVTAQALRDHRHRQVQERLAAGPAWVASDLVFVAIGGRPIHPDRFSKVFQNHVANSGLPRLTLHGLRHTHATLALKAGAHPKVVSERLGHATVGITLDTYSHVVPSMQREMAQSVADLVLGRT